MKTLEQHNADQWKAHEERQRLGQPHRNGIACPKCGKELWDSHPMLTLTTYPAQKNVHCESCGHVGYRLA